MIVSALTAIYLVPTWLALHRRHNAAVFIFWLNLLLGWTLIGWAVAFVWAGTRSEPRQLRTDYTSGRTPNISPSFSIIEEDDGLGDYATWLRRNRGKWSESAAPKADDRENT